MAARRRNRDLGAVFLSLVVLAGCSNAPNASSNASPNASGGPSETPEASLPNGLVQPVTPSFEDATLTEGAQAELDQLAASRADAGFEALLGANAAAAFEALDDAETALGEAILPKAATDLGIDVSTGQALVAAANGGPGGNDRPPPPATEWTGSMLSHSSFTIAMMTSLFTMTIELAGRTGEGATTRNDSQTSTSDGVSETVNVTTDWRLTHGQGSMTGDVEINATAKATAADGSAIGNLVGKAVGHLEINACPDAAGHAKGRLSLARQEEMTPAGGTGAGFAKSFDGDFTLVVDDDAKLTQIDVQMNLRDGAHGGEGGDWNATIGIPATIKPDGGVDFDSSNVVANGTASQTQVQATMNGYMSAYPIIVEVAKRAQDFWRSGACIELTTSEESRSVKPDEEVSLTVDARGKFDGNQVKGGIVATFSGKKSLDPTGTKVEAPATYTFVAGSNRGDTGTIKLEQKSRRGIGLKTVEFKVDAALHFGGTIRFEEVQQYGSRTNRWSGTAEVVLLVDDISWKLTAEPDGSSTYSYDWDATGGNSSAGGDCEVGKCTLPPCESHLTGPLVDPAQFTQPTQGLLIAVGALGADTLNLQITMVVSCGGKALGAIRLGCREDVEGLVATFDRVANYRIDCSFAFDHTSQGFANTRRGHVEGTLSPLDGPFPTR